MWNQIIDFNFHAHAPLLKNSHTRLTTAAGEVGKRQSLKSAGISLLE